MPILREEFQKLDDAPLIINEIAVMLKKNSDTAFKIEEIDQVIFGDTKGKLYNYLFERISLLILKQLDMIEIKRMPNVEGGGHTLYYAWKISNDLKSSASKAL